MHWFTLHLVRVRINKLKMILKTLFNLIICCTGFISFNGLSQSDQDSCDWKRIEELGVLFRDTLGPKPVIITDPNNSNVGMPNITRSWVPQILANDYFDSCLKGKEPAYFINLLGSANLAVVRTSHNESGYLLHYSMQYYDDNGKPLDPLPSAFIIEFNSEKKAIFLYETAY